MFYFINFYYKFNYDYHKESFILNNYLYIIIYILLTFI